MEMCSRANIISLLYSGKESTITVTSTVIAIVCFQFFQLAISLMADGGAQACVQSFQRGFTKQAMNIVACPVTLYRGASPDLKNERLHPYSSSKTIFISAHHSECHRDEVNNQTPPPHPSLTSLNGIPLSSKSQLQTGDQRANSIPRKKRLPFFSPSVRR